MRIAYLILLVASCAACGLVSGLDGLQVGDASGEATTDASTDAADAGNDVGTPPLPCLYSPSTINACLNNPSTCASPGTDAGCCVTPDAGASCQPTCASPSFFLGCSTSKQCNATASTCCLLGVTAPSGTQTKCPLSLQLGVSDSVSAQCGTDQQCLGQPRLCTSSADCPTGKACEQVVVDTSPVVFGACVPIQ